MKRSMSSNNTKALAGDLATGRAFDNGCTCHQVCRCTGQESLVITKPYTKMHSSVVWQKEWPPMEGDLYCNKPCIEMPNADL